MAAFRIRQLYKTNNSPVPADDGATLTYYDPQEIQQIMNTIKQFTQRSSNQVSASDLREALRNSSINPDNNPLLRDSVNAMLKNKDDAARDRNAPFSEGASKGLAGFSAETVNRINSATLQNRRDEELKQELQKIQDNRRDHLADIDDDTEAAIVSSTPVSDEIPPAKRLKRTYPPRASMLRGAHARTIYSGAGGIKRTEYGIPDAF